MDFPISVPSIGLVDGKLVDEDPLVGTPGSLIPSQWGNAVTLEILNVIQAAGLTPDEDDNTQLRAAISAIVTSGFPAATEIVAGKAKLASQPDAESGADNAKIMTPLRVFQAIAKTVVQATETVFGWAKIATQALTDAGVDDSTIVTPKKLRKGVSFSLGVNGYVALPSWLGGFIFQWGGATTAAGGGVFVTWPTAFPNAVLHASGSANSAGVTPAIITVSAGLPNGSFYASNGSGAGVAIGIFWLAIGR